MSDFHEIERLKEEVFNLVEEFKLGTHKFDDHQTQAMTNWARYGFVKKDVENNELLFIANISFQGDELVITTDNGLVMSKPISKEKKYFENILEIDMNQVQSKFNDPTFAESWFEEMQPIAKVNKIRDKVEFSLYEGYQEQLRKELYDQLETNDKFYYADVVARNKGGFLVEIDGLGAFMPGSLASANKIINFDDYIGRRVPVMVEDYISEINEIVVSNKKYLQFEIPRQIAKLGPGDVARGTITGTTKFGIFVEFDEIFTGLLHESEMRGDTHDKFKRRVYNPGDKFEVYIKNVERNNKIILTEKIENIVTFSLLDVKEKYEGQIVEGKVTNLHPKLGAFVKLIIDERSDLTGLIYKDYLHHIKYNEGDLIKIKITLIDMMKENIQLVPFTGDDEPEN